MTQRYRILSVDDNAAIHDDFRKLLVEGDFDRDLADISAELFGDGQSEKAAVVEPAYELDTALQGQEGYEMVKAAVVANEPYAMAFVDLRMPPGWDGIETIQKMWEVDPALQVVVCSAYSDYSWREMVAALGATDRMLFLRKPFDGVAVKQIALALTEKWRITRNLHDELENLEFSVAERTYDLRTALEELEQKNLELLMAADARADFVARMSHELRTPLNGVLGMTQLLADTQLQTQQIRNVTTIQRCGDALLRVLDDIVDFSQIEAGQVLLESHEFDLRELIDDTLSMFVGTLDDEQVELAAIIDPQAPKMVEADLGRIRQILTGLVAGACQVTTRGSVIVRVEVVESSVPESFLRISVEDTGPGLSRQQQETAFAPFAAQEGGFRRRGSSGLDLAIAQRLVERMHGSMGLRSEPGRGSAFWLSLPIPMARSKFTEDTGKIALLVGGSHLVAESVSACCKSFGVSVQRVDGIDEATRMIREKHGQIEFVFCDQSYADKLQAGVAALTASMPAVAVKLVVLIAQGTGFSDADFMGTGFERVLRLPLRSGEIADLFERDTQGSGIDQRKAISLHFDGRVLLVEDEEVNRVIAQKLLESHGCTVVVARDGEDALEKIEREHFDLILMDIKMPGMGGVEATRLYRAREERSRSGLHLPIVALTASVLPETREETQVAGMDGFLAKPLRREELAEVLTRWLPRARMREVS